GIVGGRNNDRNSLGRVLGGERCGRRARDDEIDPEPDHLGGERREALHVAFREPTLEDEVPPFAIPALTQPVQERIPHVGEWRSRVQVADPVDLARRLRLSGERCHKDTEGENNNDPYGTAPHDRLLYQLTDLPATLMEAKPLMRIPFCPLPALPGRHNNGHVICLTRCAVNSPHPAMQSERVVLGEKGAVAKKADFFYRFTKDANVDPLKSQ